MCWLVSAWCKVHTQQALLCLAGGIWNTCPKNPSLISITNLVKHVCCLSQCRERMEALSSFVVCTSKSWIVKKCKKILYLPFYGLKYWYLPSDTFRKHVERHVTRRKLSLKLTGYCRQSSYTDSEVVFTLLPAVAWVLKSQFAPGYMHFNKCFEGVSGKRGIFHNGKLAIEVFFLSRPAIDFSYTSSSSLQELLQ